MRGPLEALARIRRWYGQLGEPLSGADADLAAVATSAALLEVSEFRFFELAHERWFGRPASRRHCEGLFLDYMFRDAVPPWVRHLARQVMALAARQELDTARLVPEEAEQTPRARAWGILTTVAVHLILVLFCLLISGYTPY